MQAPATGAFTRVIPIEVPAFFGIEPRLALAYSSQGGNGIAGVGWSLAGYSVIARTRTGRGVPRYDAADVFTLNGQELLPCSVATTSPGCAAGGTHATKQESYQRIVFDAGTDTWTVWSTSGIRVVFSPVFDTPRGTLRWGQTQTIDTHGNTVTYTWTWDNGDAYLDRVTFGPFAVRLFRAARNDVSSYAIGIETQLGWSRRRLNSIVVQREESTIRAYRLTYDTSPSTQRSLLAAVQQFGTDAQVDAAGSVTGGTALPPQTFQYQQDAASGTLQSWPDGTGL